LLFKLFYYLIILKENKFDIIITKQVQLVLTTNGSVLKNIKPVLDRFVGDEIFACLLAKEPET